MNIVVANKSHSKYAVIISQTMAESAKVRGTGIAQRTPEYIVTKMENGNAIIALDGDIFAGFCYIEAWGHEKFVANSGLIVHFNYRNKGLAKQIKQAVFNLSRKKFPNAKIFGITTGLAVMKINYDLGYKPVTFSELTDDPTFWKGCQTCKNYDILQRTEQKMCLCTAMLFDPLAKKAEQKHPYNKTVLQRLKHIKQLLFLKNKKIKPMKKLVLAYSGGLDTSFCAKYLNVEKGFQIYAVSINTGGFTNKEINTIKEKAYALGVKEYVNIDAIKTFYNDVVKYLIYGNILKNNTYPLSVSAERIIQALEIISYAKKIGAKYIAHGSTGAGNDQVRFDMIFQILAPEIEIITPIRDLQLSREAEIEYLQKQGVQLSWEKAKYSINKGLWGTSIGGAETLTSHLPLPDEAFPSTLEEKEPQKVTLTFVKGELTAINGKQHHSTENIELLNQIASKYAIGRDIHVGDTIIGIKGRVGFEAAAPLIIIKAHHALEKHVLTKWQLHHKEYLSNWYGMLLHEGQYLDEVMRNIEAFLESSQKTVTGDVYVTLYPYRFSIDGISSKHDLMNASFGSYGEMNKSWTYTDAKGFIKILSNQNKIYQHVNKETS